jgi:hypothetical protein
MKNAPWEGGKGSEEKEGRGEEREGASINDGTKRNK